MQVFTGQFDRTVDAKNRIQLPAPLRAAINPKKDGPGLYITLGERRGTLSIYTERAFEALSARLETEFEADENAQRFELQFYGLTNRVDVDAQGRFVVPEKLLRKARLREQVVLVGQKFRIDVWSPAELDRAMGIDWEGEDWPDWPRHLRRRPSAISQND